MGVNALLVYPEMPPTYWSMRYALPFLGRKAVLPPLGLLTVAAMLPPSWKLKVLDLNVEPISKRDLDGVDLVLTSAMLVQRASFEALIELCRESGKPVVAGGPLPTSCHETIEGVDFFVLGEAEVNLPIFLEDFKRGVPRHCYRDLSHPDITSTPPPRYDLVNRKRYAGAALQYSRGCPHDCEFCDIVELFGHRPRTKSVPQFLAELDLLFNGGWRGSLFVVDDNFIGNRSHVRSLLPELTHWQARRHYPFSLFTEASLDLAADDALMEGMVEAGFNMVFVGIETPDKATLVAIEKPQNSRSDLLASVQAIQRKGLEVSGGFIVGFDGDRADIFDRQIHFIKEAAIPTAMVGMLTAIPGTRLHDRLAAEGRVLGGSSSGNNTHDLELNFLPRMDAALLRGGYKRVLEEVYTPSHYFARCLRLILRMKRRKASCRRIRIMELRAFFHSLMRQTFSRYGIAYWTYLLKGLSLRPLMAAEIIALAVKGHHFFTITQGLLSLERFKERLEDLRGDLETRLKGSRRDNPIKELEAYRERLLKRARTRCRRIHPDLRESAIQLFEEFRANTELLLSQGSPITR
jgi:radical SAM superfamily enzyme YgiQ (UPF0313 family)